MSNTPPDSTSENLTRLLTEWIHADTWNASEAILKANSERLLSDEALKALDDLLSENAEDEDLRRTLLKHKTILETAQAESIDAAYAELLKPSPLTLALEQLPDELHDAIKALIDANSLEEWLEQIA